MGSTSLRTFVGTLRTHLKHIMAFIDRHLTNAVGEGLNRIIKIVKNRASGYRHLDHFADMIYLGLSGFPNAILGPFGVLRG